MAHFSLPVSERVNNELLLNCILKWESTCLFFFSHSALIVPPSFHPAAPVVSTGLPSSSFAMPSFRLHTMSHPAPGPKAPSLSSRLTVKRDPGGYLASFSIRDSQTAVAILFGTKGKVVLGRGGWSGVMTRRLRHIGQSTDSCHPPQVTCRREKNHFKMQRPQNVWPHWPGFRMYGWAITS